ncbi:methyltransferase domain-containing protein [Paenibacillus tarimensis]|uniref:methyltransferase domain-containing protein n=1 Tax=Paenibacillus tarimensis TaxID=416012 RepID=UPI001F3B5550|nr:methyltransferase domain-containing protein [Paenibacillus tarimensis]MCF2943838.1 methyltransferase domain-containing protein [Paenibacillus tarimensis]
MAANSWQAEDYDRAMAFVSRGGEDLIEIIRLQPGESAVDWGCGTGDLTAKLASSGAAVTGVDFSREMIERARSKYPNLQFVEADGQAYRTAKPVDAIFSNAALHWMTDAERTAASIAASLRVGGRFVAEFGADGNIASIVHALQKSAQLLSLGRRIVLPWYFPTPEAYQQLLEKHGFRVLSIYSYDRPTPLSGGEQGLQIWLDHFAGGVFAGLDQEEERAVRRYVEEAVKPLCYRDGSWTADYRRLRVAAVKQS